MLLLLLSSLLQQQYLHFHSEVAEKNEKRANDTGGICLHLPSRSFSLIKVDEQDGSLDFENVGNAEVNEVGGRDVPKVTHQYHLRSSRPSDNEKGKGLAIYSPAAAVIQDVFGDIDDLKEEVYAAHYQISENNRSPKCERSSVKESQAGIVPCEDAFHESETLVAFEIPLCYPPADSNRMAILKLSSLIGIDPKPFDPETYVEDDFYVTDSSGFKTLIPHTNIIRWRKVKNPDGTTSVESNAKFVTWSDGSMQLLIGKEAFNVSENDVKETKSHLFLQHGKGIYQCQGKVNRKMKLTPFCLSSDSDQDRTACGNSRYNRKVIKVREYIPNVDSETKLGAEKEKGQTKKFNKQLKEKKMKVFDAYVPKARRSRWGFN